MRIMNATPHGIDLVGAEGEPVLTIPPSGLVARCRATTRPAGVLSAVADGTVIEVPTSVTVFGEVEDLPDRADLLVPAEMVRDGDGRILGARSLGR